MNPAVPTLRCDLDPDDPARRRRNQALARCGDDKYDCRRVGGYHYRHRHCDLARSFRPKNATIAEAAKAIAPDGMA